MKNLYKWVVIPSFLVIIFTFCNNQNKTESTQNNIKQDQVSYKLDMIYNAERPENTEVNWYAYKTNEKIKVSGSFSEFSSDRENQAFNSINDLVDGLYFSISSLSSSSGDETRDLNIKDYFFKHLTDNFEINGTLGKPVNDSIDIFFDIFEKNKPIRFAYSSFVIPDCKYGDQIIEIKGTINLVNHFDGVAYASISAKCVDLHKGADGISRTWDEVDVHIKALVINETNPGY
jgi:hypothetical protein